MEREYDGDTNCNWDTWISQTLGNKTEKIGNRRTNEDHPDYSITEIGQNTENSPGDLRRFSVSQTPVRNHQLTLV